MPKFISLLLVLLILIPSAVLSQNGYKDFKWGDDVKTIRKKVPDIEVNSWMPTLRGLLTAYFYENSDLYESSIPDPLSKINGKLLIYDSPKESITFYFLNSKLFGVELTFSGERVIDDLESKYGHAPSKSMTVGENTFEVKAWFNSQGRVITYETFYDHEYVTYIDAKVYEPAATKLKTERSKQNEQRRNKVD